MGQRGSFSGAEESSACECGQDEADRQDITRCIGRAESATPRHAPQNRFQLSTTSVACRTTHTFTLTFTLTIQLPFLSASPSYIHTHARHARALRTSLPEEFGVLPLTSSSRQLQSRATTAAGRQWPPHRCLPGPRAQSQHEAPGHS